ncbi:hypothetical protein TNIN_330461 [Trichonephila inaurata madagascariensis]|uniref:Uncharacterized protein n=1 Tax=Trichonephila inaurata madagascariensis TaxID=2747483 RepID=A0A8X6YIR6_9ARAC|nr:hypothetical protein TNIN_330461 [Trichonephila inaurata madagascariensis]
MLRTIVMNHKIFNKESKENADKVLEKAKFRFTYDPAYVAKDCCYGQKGRLQCPSKPVGAAVTPKCNHHLNSNRDSSKYVGLSAKRCSKEMDVFGVKSLTDVKGSNPTLIYSFAC